MMLDYQLFADLGVIIGCGVLCWGLLIIAFTATDLCADVMIYFVQMALNIVLLPFTTAYWISKAIVKKVRASTRKERRWDTSS